MALFSGNVTAAAVTAKAAKPVRAFWVMRWFMAVWIEECQEGYPPLLINSISLSSVVTSMICVELFCDVAHSKRLDVKKPRPRWPGHKDCVVVSAGKT